MHDVFGEGERVAVRWTGTGTHTGEMMGVPPSGVRVSATGIFVFHFREGKIVEYWENWDTLGFFQQIGAIPSPAQVSA